MRQLCWLSLYFWRIEMNVDIVQIWNNWYNCCKGRVQKKSMEISILSLTLPPSPPKISQNIQTLYSALENHWRILKCNLKVLKSPKFVTHSPLWSVRGYPPLKKIFFNAFLDENAELAWTGLWRFPYFFLFLTLP